MSTSFAMTSAPAPEARAFNRSRIPEISLTFRICAFLKPRDSQIVWEFWSSTRSAMVHPFPRRRQQRTA